MMEKSGIVKIIGRSEASDRAGPPDDELVLPYELRRKTRQRVRLASGREAGIFLPRGSVIQNGDRLYTDEGLHVLVKAAHETLSVARVKDHLLLARIAYHLGNRHVPVKIESDRLVYLQDHLLDEMVCRLGATVSIATGPFEPEEGAYHSGEPHQH